ncbi:MAG: PQQ-binding-like beta-propeller repeat protein, partial [Bacteroidota bacterium]|nr:PQQ-binding-like beta-propeller repeat protein [Bacteroidota bacterium]
MKRFFFLLLLLIPFFAQSQVNQFGGPHRNGSYPDKNLLDKWPDGGPQLLLTVEGIGTGWSSAVTTDKAIYITGMKDTLDYLTSIDFTGKINWQVPYGRAFTKSFPDTRCTPTIEGNKIWVVSGTGKLSCFDATTGKEIWSVDVDKQFESKWFMWGVAESPLIVDDKVICSPYGDKTALVAFDKNTGKLIWQSKSVGGKRSYVSPVLYTYQNFRYILSENTEKVIAVNAENGDIAWEYKCPKGAEISPNCALFKDDEIYITRGYNVPSVMLKMAPDGKSVTEKWKDTVLDCHHGGVVLVNGTIYGANWINNGKGKWCSLDWNTGKIGYETEWINKGSIITADNKLICYE